MTNVVKPFEMRELEARIRTLLRPPWEGPASTMRVGALLVVPGEPQIWLDGQPVTVPPGELGLLEMLAARVGRAVSKATLAHSVSGTDRIRSDVAIEVGVHRARRRLAPYGLEIRSLRGFGYMLVESRRQAVAARGAAPESAALSSTASE